MPSLLAEPEAVADFPEWGQPPKPRGRTRLALAIGMMPRGEVCAAIILNAIALGAEGTAITIAMLCLAVNMTCVSGFIFMAKHLSKGGHELPGAAATVIAAPVQTGDVAVSIASSTAAAPITPSESTPSESVTTESS